MKTIYKKIICSIVFIFICVTLLCPVAFCKTPEPTNDFFVNDYADILSDETEQEIQNTAVQLYTETTAQVCVLTIDSLEGKSISSYSVDVFRDWGIGDAEKDNGVLILVSLNDREMWVTTGYGVEGTLTDVKLGQMRDIYAIPYYSNDNFDEGTLQLFNAIVNELRVEEYGLSNLEGYDTMSNISSATNYYADALFNDGLFVIIFLFIAIPVVVPGTMLAFIEIKYLFLFFYDKKHGTLKAPTYREKSAKLKKRLLALWILANGRSRRTGTHTHHGGFGGGFGGGGGFRGGGGSTGGGGAGGSF